jgi:hypothetical protein
MSTFHQGAAVERFSGSVSVLHGAQFQSFRIGAEFITWAFCLGGRD